MASQVVIEKATRGNIPSNAVILTKDEAINMQWNIIYNWKPQSEVWPFRFGLMALSGSSAISSLIITNHYRNKLKLLSYGRLPMYIPTVFFPVFLSVIMHNKIVSSKIMLQDECPVCIQVRSMVIQCGLSVFYPLVLAPVGGFYYAMNCGSYNVPPLQKQYLPELFKLWYNMTRKLRSTFPILLGFNSIMATILTYYEAKVFFKIQNKLYENDEKLREKLEDKKIV